MVIMSPTKSTMTGATHQLRSSDQIIHFSSSDANCVFRLLVSTALNDFLYQQLVRRVLCCNQSSLLYRSSLLQSIVFAAINRLCRNQSSLLNQTAMIQLTASSRARGLFGKPIFTELTHKPYSTFKWFSHGFLILWEKELFQQ